MGYVIVKVFRKTNEFIESNTVHMMPGDRL